MNNEPVVWTACLDCGKRVTADSIHTCSPQLKELTDEEWNKAFDFYCETDEGVLKFDFELRDEWKKEQLIRWKEALRKAQEADKIKSLGTVNIGGVHYRNGKEVK